MISPDRSVVVVAVLVGVFTFIGIAAYEAVKDKINENKYVD